MLSTIALILVFIGVYYIAKLKLRGQIIMFVSQMCWMVYAVQTEQISLFLQSVGLLAFSIYSVSQWADKGVEL